ncbi:dienelactone hydrolase family protein, partial [Blastococcus sp. CCUG 61487]|uniref:dienelactone hydrolase family protein n=1 Tax=Blastococcus sp. CCUG 61487 TaxID=1840703 RepID=UPI001484F0CA
MCHDHDSRPPAPPRSGDVVERASLTLTAADGTELAAAYAAPAGTPGAGVVVLPDVRGLHPYYVALAERFAEAGLAAVAIDWFGRTAGVPEEGTRGEDFAWHEHIPRTTPEEIDADIVAAMAELRRR